LDQRSDGQRQIAIVAERLGLRQTVRLFVSPKLAGPIAFGVLRPSVGVPTDFWTCHSRTEQDAMLAHELAHLAARDPLWLALADMLAALLWWHPLVWWGRRQFRAASESAADEASLVSQQPPAKPEA
jgi:D-alanyl-D-alanine endopeptidase (penicillin-binding protein 7)